MNTQKIEITTKTLIVITLFFVGLWAFIQIKEVILLLFVSFILMSALYPLAERLAHLRIPRVLSIIIVYLFFLSILGIIISSITIPLIDEVQKLIDNLPQIITQLSDFFQIDRSLINPMLFREQLTPVSSTLIQFTASFFNNLIALISLIVITFYLLLERQQVEEHFIGFFHASQQEKVRRIIVRIEDKLGAWFRGQMLLCTIIGVLSYIGLRILGIEFALSLALFAGILEILPVIGPLISAIPAILIALITSPVLALAVAALYFLIQQLEGHLIVPNVMRRIVGLNPLATILAITIGGKLLGIAGALLAVPIVVVLQITFQEFINLQTAKK